MEDQSSSQIKSWMTRKLEELRYEMRREMQCKINNVCFELGECVRIQRDQIYTLLQMQPDTRETAIKSILTKKTFKIRGDLVLTVDSTTTAEERKKEEEQEKETEKMKRLGMEKKKERKRMLKEKEKEDMIKKEKRNRLEEERLPLKRDKKEEDEEERQ
ncbi:hypothetical protein KOW79_011027 [Hemibagrus wyckioides]|uniref:Uncharacterized protein n=1 Tax=Hemibagrus wyckioides TaxID=337641 RepID=A0A9D3SHM3_9TELE|nr:hypothetical protein KOW79_011027 [Hemibagrus wyckioides]